MGEVLKYFLALPSRDGRNYHSVLAGINGVGDVTAMSVSISLLARGFNMAWVECLSLMLKGEQIDRFVLMHDDIATLEREASWLGQLETERAANACDVLSVIVPIKNPVGYSSTGVQSSIDPWAPVRRLTQTEVWDLPETFGNDILRRRGFAKLDEQIAVNTGCMIVDMTAPWVKKMQAETKVGETGVGFHVDDQIRRTEEGKWSCETRPEDWAFSYDVQNLGALVMATRRVKVKHMGQHGWANFEVWGEATDTTRTI